MILFLSRLLFAFFVLAAGIALWTAIIAIVWAFNLVPL